jgi:CheY-like chemotaxis protein
MDSAEIHFSLDLPDRPLSVNADPERLSQIIDNLLRNAVKFTSPGGSISVSARRQGAEVEILMRDSGVGIDADELAHIFEPYYQGHSVGGQGLGLGLTLVKQLIELQGGTVTVHSAGRNLGSEFVLRLPVTEAADSSQAPVAIATQTLRVLVVDDQVDIADSFATLLEGLGQHVRVAYSGNDALEIARRHRPHVAFLDLAMPGMDGHELAKRLRTVLADCTLVAVTGFGSAHAGETAKVFDRRMLKPVAVDALTEVLNNVSPVRQPAG